MSNTKSTLYYLYDPMCGWCYGAWPGIAALASDERVQVKPLPSGLFAQDLDRKLDPAFTQHILQADARIEAMSGQPFSDAYKREVLQRPELPFHSRTASEALTAVAQVDPAAELDALHAIQRARYVDGRDIADRQVLADALAQAIGGDTDSWLQRLNDPALPAATDERFGQAQSWMAQVGARGVPSLVLVEDERVSVVPNEVLFRR